MDHKKSDIRKLGKDELKKIVLDLGEPSFRANQIIDWIWKKGATTFEEMTNLSKDFRLALNEKYTINAIDVDKVQHSIDGTIKFRFKLHDGFMMESVLIPVPDEKRFTVCVSCQVGCSLTCKFCATGQMKRVRNLDAFEIVDQVVMVNKECMKIYGLPLTNIVYMGMGEPLLAFAPVMESIDIISSPEGLNMSSKRITVSTAGVAKMIEKMADENVKFNLALSLHAADDEKRNEIMPINETNSLEVLMDALEYFYNKTKNNISYEYIAFDGFNDSLDDARNLVKLSKRFPVKINVIEYNPVSGLDFVKAEEDKINQFASLVRANGVMITLRRSRGKDIDAACGQLANKE